ncbi:MAG TPA: AMIN domain-containing protein [Gemmatimonadales bacterium]
MMRVWRLAAPAALALSLNAVAAPASALPIGAGGAGSAAAAVGSVSGLSVIPAAGRTDVVIALDGAAQIADFTVDSPSRIVLDIQPARLGMSADAYDRVPRGAVRNIRFSQFDRTTVRVVLDVDGRRDYEVVNSGGAVRVSVSGGGDFEAWSSNGGTMATAAPSHATPPRDAEPAPQPAAARDYAPAYTRAAANRPFGEAAPAVQRQQPEQRRITVTFEARDIRDVIAAFAELSGRTIVLGRDVQGEVSAEIRDQPWDVALQAILNANGLAATEDASGIITVDSYSNILLKQSSEPLVTRLVQVNYAKATGLVPTVQSLLSRDCRAAAAAAADPAAGGGGAASQQCAARGQVVADSATNSLLISEVPSRMGELLNYIKSLDVRTPQVAIKGRIISVNRTATEQLGLSYDLGSARSFSNRLAPRLDAEGEPIPGDFVIELGGNALTGIANADRKYGQNSALGLIFSTALGKFSLTSFLDALSENRLSDVQAEPQATTLDNRTARILVGQETPVRVIDYGAGGTAGALPRANVQFRETGIILEVTPQITNNRQIVMDVYAEQSELQIVGGDLGFFLPKRNVKTRVIVRDGETMALGGLTQTQVTKNRSGIPILSDLPLIGRLFSQTETREEKQDLLILLTPHIIDAESGTSGR